MRFEKGRRRTCLTLEYGVVLLMLRNLIQISWSQGLSFVDLWDIQERRFDTTFTAVKNNLYLLQKGSSYRKVSIC